MSKKKKLLKYSQSKTFSNFFEPVFDFSKPEDFFLKSNWNTGFFKNENPIVLELGCGKGEYTVELAKKNKEINYIGVDIKGARMWKGASDSLAENISNVAFLRTYIEFSQYCFSKNEVSEIWITFPDPQLGPKKRIHKRLTSPEFLTRYQSFLINNGIVNLKTDDDTLYKYTREIIFHNNLEILADTDDLYDSDYFTDVLAIKTHYEKMWNKQRKTIKYIRFVLPHNVIITSPVNEDEDTD
jgi:tRNA (guanine-N7-)-methyltransferase